MDSDMAAHIIPFGGLAALMLTPASIIVSQAQAADPTGGWLQVVSVYGPFAPFALFLLVVIWTLWKKVDRLEGQLLDAQKLTIETVVPALTESNRLIADSSTVIKEASEALHRTADSELWRRLTHQLDRLEHQEHT